MKNCLIIFFAFTAISIAQFKEQQENLPSVSSRISNGQPSSMFLGFLNMENFSMNHSVGMSYSSWGSNGVMLGTYTNSMFYKFSDDLNVQLETSLVTSPYSTFGDQFSKDISGLYISHAALNYKISENSSISVQYFNPMGGYYPYGFSRYGYSPFGYYSPFYNSLPSGLDRK